MKKGTKGNSLKHKLAPLNHSGFIATAIVLVTVAIVSFGTLVINIWTWCIDTPQGSDYVKDLGNIIISSVSFLTSAIGSFCSITKLVHDSFHRKFLEDPTYKQEIIKTIGKTIESRHNDNGYVWNKYQDMLYLSSDKVDKAMSDAFPAKKHGESEKPQHDVLLKVSRKIQPLSSDQSEALYQKVKQKRAEGKNIFNSKLVRLRTDMFIDGILSGTQTKIENLKFTDANLVEVEKTDYYSNMTSNDLIYDRLFKYDHSSIYYGKDMTVHGDVLYNLSQSPAANIIGVTTLAITSDKKLVINKQDNNNDVNNDCYVPSGSGSADFEDLKKCRKLEKKTKTITYADQLENINKIYKSINLRKNRKEYKNAVKAEIKCLKYKKTVNEDDFKKNLQPLKDTYENGIKTKKEHRQLKRYCKTLRKYTCSFRNFITYGMTREFVEESHVCETTKHKISPSIMKCLMEKTEICGYIRILDRGGKPDFLGITYLDYTEEELKEKFLRIGLKVAKKELDKHSAINDYSEVRSQFYLPLEKLKNCNDFKTLFPKSYDEKGNENEVKISLQLHCLLTILKNKL